MLNSDVESIVHLTSLTSKLLTKSDKLLNIPKIDFSQDSTEYSTEVAPNSVDSRLSEKAELECLKTQMKNDTKIRCELISSQEQALNVIQNEKIPFRFTIMETIARRRSGGTVAGTQFFY